MSKKCSRVVKGRYTDTDQGDLVRPPPKRGKGKKRKEKGKEREGHL